MPPKFHLSFLIHAHQPAGNFEDVFERCYRRAYLPFVQHLEKHTLIRAALHFSGPLLTWIGQYHPEYFELLRSLVYEPILAVIPAEDQREQIERLAAYLEEHFGERPSGAWLAERVWEPQLPSVLAAAQVNYTLVDDFHFLAAGFEPSELFGAYLAEDRGKAVRVFAGQKALRYLVPFGKVEEVMQYLREAAMTHPGGVAVFGDDMEKFGVWPGTFEHCYDNHWLEDFLTALENNSDWLTVTPPGEYADSRAPLGRADLPTASRGAARVFRASRGGGILAGRLVAGIFSQVSRSESVAQENAACRNASGVSAAAPYGTEGRTRSRDGPRSTSPRAVQRRVLAWRFRRVVRAASTHRIVAKSNPCGTCSRQTDYWRTGWAS